MHIKKKVQRRGKAGTRSGVAEFKKRSIRAVRHSAKQAVGGLAQETGDRAEAKLSDETYREQHPEPLPQGLVLKSKPAKRKKRGSTAAATAKKRAEALQKSLEAEARLKAARKAKRRAAARALKKAREE
jgi:hypothetical protein